MTDTESGITFRRRPDHSSGKVAVCAYRKTARATNVALSDQLER
jgi:hypothetical protein